MEPLQDAAAPIINRRELCALADKNVKFYFGAQARYDALPQKDALALYFITDTQRLYKGDTLIASGANATGLAAGLMSAEDKIKLDSLSAQGMNLQSVDGTIRLTDGDAGQKLIGVAISAVAGNALVKHEDGLFVPVSNTQEVASYAIERMAAPEDGFAASYRLKKVVDGTVTYEGDAINIAKDMVLHSAAMRHVVAADIPYAGAVVGDPYIEMIFNDAEASHIYIPMKDLVDTYIAGDGIQIVDHQIGLKLGSATNGLVVVDGALQMELADDSHAGAMSAEMFTAVNGLLELDLPNQFGRPNAEQFSIRDGVLSLEELDADRVLYEGKKLSQVLADLNAAYIWEELPEVVDSPAENASEAMESMSAGGVLRMGSGVAAQTMTVDKSATVSGIHAGIAQNYLQEV